MLKSNLRSLAFEQLPTFVCTAVCLFLIVCGSFVTNEAFANPVCEQIFISPTQSSYKPTLGLKILSKSVLTFFANASVNYQYSRISAHNSNGRVIQVEMGRRIGLGWVGSVYDLLKIDEATLAEDTEVIKFPHAIKLDIHPKNLVWISEAESERLAKNGVSLKANSFVLFELSLVSRSN